MPLEEHPNLAPSLIPLRLKPNSERYERPAHWLPVATARVSKIAVHPMFPAELSLSVVGIRHICKAEALERIKSFKIYKFQFHNK